MNPLYLPFFIIVTLCISCNDTITEPIKNNTLPDTTILQIEINGINDSLHIQLEKFHAETWIGTKTLHKVDKPIYQSFAKDEYGLYRFSTNGKPSNQFLIGGEDTITIRAKYQDIIQGKVYIANSIQNEWHDNLQTLNTKHHSKNDSLFKAHAIISYNTTDYYAQKALIRNEMKQNWKAYNDTLKQIQTILQNTYLGETIIPMYLRAPNFESPENGVMYDNHWTYFFKHFFKHFPLDNATILAYPKFNQSLFEYLQLYKGNGIDDFLLGADNILIDQRIESNVRDYMTRFFAGYYMQQGYKETAEQILDAHIKGCADDAIDKLRENDIYRRGLSLSTQVPDFTIKDYQSNPISLSKTYKDNRLTLLYFWRTNCTHCEAEHQNLQELYKIYKSEKFEIIGISIDENKKDFNQTIEKFNMPWIKIGGEKKVAEIHQSYYVLSTPSNFLINQEGILKGKNLTTEELRKTIASSNAYN